MNIMEKLKVRLRKDPKNVTSKNELKIRSEALIHSFERFKFVFQYK